MVKIRLRRMGNRHRPFYRIVVAPSTAARNGKFTEQLGTYNPLTQPKEIKLDKERAMYWLMEGAKPTETVARLLKNEGVLEEFLTARPKAKDYYKFLDKTTAAMSKASVVSEVKAEEAPAEEVPAEEPAAEAPAEEPVAEAAPAEEAPVAEEAAPEAPAEEAPAEEPAAEEAPAEEPAAEEEKSE